MHYRRAGGGARRAGFWPDRAGPLTFGRVRPLSLVGPGPDYRGRASRSPGRGFQSAGRRHFVPALGDTLFYSFFYHHSFILYYSFSFFYNWESGFQVHLGGQELNSTIEVRGSFCGIKERGSVLVFFIIHFDPFIIGRSNVPNAAGYPF